jgi:hypothetical protein
MPARQQAGIPLLAAAGSRGAMRLCGKPPAAQGCVIRVCGLPGTESSVTREILRELNYRSVIEPMVLNVKSS